ncbi:hypothetical protein LPJ56_004406 [Coemansia sp. RSA 2599]|nr:hypothetical protein LPJ56_004406 [Coemansia sp. RSA 2599]
MAVGAETEMTMLDFRRRASSHIVAGAGTNGSALLGLGPATTLQPQQHYMTLPLPRQQQQQMEQQMQQQQPQNFGHPYTPAPTATGTLDMDVDLELARPLELWQMPLDVSLLWLPPTAAAVGRSDAGRNDASALASLFPAGYGQLDMATAAVQDQRQPGQHQQPLHTEIICDTRFIDARSSAIAQARKGAEADDSTAAPASESLGPFAPAMTEEQMRTALDSVLRSPTSLLPHWPEQVKDPVGRASDAPEAQARKDAPSDAASHKRGDKARL